MSKKKEVYELKNDFGVPLFGTIRKDGTIHFAGISREAIINHFRVVDREDVERNLKLAEEGKPFDMPLSVLNGELKKLWFKPLVKAKKRAYNQKPEVKAKRRAYNQKPEVKARTKAYQKAHNQKPEVKARKKAYQKAYNQKPEVKARKKAYYQKKKKE